VEKVNRTLVREKLDSAMLCVSRIRSKLPKNQKDFLIDVDLQDIVSVNLERAVQSCVDVAAHLVSYGNLPSVGTMADAFRALESAKILTQECCEKMRKAVGLRNLLVHQYKKIDWNLVWKVSDQNLNDIVEFCTQVLKWSESEFDQP
jgi:uncharacterized protein YutE (UPF0331/DUF86 family)